MRILIKSRNYLMKCLVFVLLFGFISLGAIGGCNNNGGGSSQDARALTERDFFNNPGLSANPEDGVVVVFLEPTEASEEDNLTGGLGFDIIPHKYTQTLNHTFCWEDNNVDSKHFMILRNSDGEEVLRALANGGCVTERIEAGDYEMVLTHGEHVEGIQTVFLIPAVEDQQVTKRNEFNQKGTKTANAFSSKMHRYIPGGLVKFFESISNVFTRPAIAQTDTGTNPDNFTTLINTNSCERCDLTGVDLPFVVLPGAVLTFADLSGANLSNADLTGAILFETQLIGTNLSNTDLSNTDLRGANLSNADLTGADLTEADLEHADLMGANLTGADVTGADLEFADLTFATWIDGSTCDFTSIGICNSSSADATPCDKLTLSNDNIIKCLLPTTDNSVNLAEIFNQASSATSLNLDIDTPFAVLAWGGDGGIGSFGLFGGGDGGESGFASTVTTLSDIQNSFGQTSLFYYVAQGGTLSNVCGDGGASTLVMFVESSPSSLDDVLLIAGGGGGGEDGGVLTTGGDGGKGGIAAASKNGQGFIGLGQGIADGPDGGSTSGNGVGGSGDNDGKDGIGGEGGSGFLGANSTWLNGDPGVGSNGRGGNAADSGVFDDGCGGGGGGYGGGGASDGDAGAGGGSFSSAATLTCSAAPNNDSVPSNPGTDRDILGSHNGAVEVWIFADGC